jgi:hypothetical protein
MAAADRRQRERSVLDDAVQPSASKKIKPVARTRGAALSEPSAAPRSRLIADRLAGAAAAIERI